MRSARASRSSGSAPASRPRAAGGSSLGSQEEVWMAADERPRVLILGGGFAGVGAAQKLKKADADVVLVDRHDYHTFQPLLYQFASGLLEQTAVGHSLRDLVERQENTTVH